MRTVISLLVSSLVFGSLAFNRETMLSSLTHLLLASSSSPDLLSARPQPKSSQSETPNPHRGSGRRQLMEYFQNAYPAI
jgi:hypothetical protein